MEINVLETLKDYINNFGQYISKKKKDTIIKRNSDCTETLKIYYIDSSIIENNIYKFYIVYTYSIKSLFNDEDVGQVEATVEYNVSVYIIASLDENGKINNIYGIDYTHIIKNIDIFYESYRVSSSDKKDITPLNHIDFNDDTLSKINIFNGKDYEKEISDIQSIFGKEEIQVIKNNKYGEYDSLLMENLINIINEYKYNIDELSSKEYLVILGNKNNKEINAHISIEYIDEPVCEEEYASGYFVDFKIRISEDTYLLTYNIRPYNYEDSIYEVRKLIIDDKDFYVYKAIYRSTFMIEMQDLDNSLDNTAEINYSII